MKIFAIDPGSTYSAYVLYDSSSLTLLDKGKIENFKMLEMLTCIMFDLKIRNAKIAIEYPQPRGQPMYTQVVDTIYWIGRFVQAIGREDWRPIDRKDVKMFLCGRCAKVSDANVNAAIRSYFESNPRSLRGGGKNPIKGTKKKPGVLFGVSADVWAALGVALTTLDFYERESITDEDFLS